MFDLESRRVVVRSMRPGDDALVAQWEWAAMQDGGWRTSGTTGQLAAGPTRIRMGASGAWIVRSRRAGQAADGGREVGLVCCYDFLPVDRSAWISLLGRTPGEAGTTFVGAGMVCHELFMSGRVERLYAETSSDNEVVEHALELAGFRRAVTLRDGQFRHGAWRDVGIWRCDGPDWFDGLGRRFESEPRLRITRTSPVEAQS